MCVICAWTQNKWNVTAMSGICLLFSINHRSTSLQSVSILSQQQTSSDPRAYFLTTSNMKCIFFLCSIGSPHGQTSCFCSISPRALCCSVITEQKWNKDQCGTSPGCLRRCCESTAAFHIKPKILGPHYCLMSLYHVQESSKLRTGVNTLS